LVASNITSLPWPPRSSSDFADTHAHYRFGPITHWQFLDGSWLKQPSGIRSCRRRSHRWAVVL